MSKKGSNAFHDIPDARKRIAKIKCFLDCVKSLQDKKPFPEPLCYVACATEYAGTSNVSWKIYEKPRKKGKPVKEINATTSSRLRVRADQVSNSDGKWLKVVQVKENVSDKFEPVPGGFAWLLLQSGQGPTAEAPVAIPVNEKKKSKATNWESYIEKFYSLSLKREELLAAFSPDHEAIANLRKMEDGWTMDHDAALVRIMSPKITAFHASEGNVGVLKHYVERIEVSSFCSCDGEALHLTDGDAGTYWESDGSRGGHWIRIHMKNKTIIKSLILETDDSDSNYQPEHIVVVAEETDGAERNLKEVEINWDERERNSNSDSSIKLLENCTKFYPILTIRFKRCRNEGIDTRVRGLKMKCDEKKTSTFDAEYFGAEKVVKYPILQPYSPEVLYKRAVVLQRCFWLLDRVMHFLVPAWQHSVDNISIVEGTSNSGLESIRQLLPLSKRRLLLIHTLIKSSMLDHGDRPTIHVNRHAAHEHRKNPAACPDYSITVFHQVHKALLSKDKITYRFGPGCEQWWECKFISEGVIDQGGGFRDCLSDIAEELCPSEADALYALPYFIRSPNQENEDGNMNKDVYVPNPACTGFAKYEWLGQLMAACFRTNDILILPLAPFVWKKLTGENVGWSEDYASVDSAEVKLIDNLTNMDQATFEVSGRNWSLVLSDGSHVSLKLDQEGNPLPLAYEDREDYAAKVREIRMAEFDKQVKAIRKGIMKGLPEAVLNLSTWQELEYHVCGEPDITVEALKKATMYDSLDVTDERVQMFWTAVKNFTVDERSKLLRFISGRRRLPVNIYITNGKSHPLNQLPESSTCANTIHLPMYSNASTCEEKLKYAIYNCVSIDTDE